MKRQLPTYALALAILVVGLVALGVPLSSLLVPLALLACPLMMIFMMRGMHDADGAHHGPTRHGHDTADRGAGSFRERC
jgi:fatty acid desaturase